MPLVIITTNLIVNTDNIAYIRDYGRSFVIVFKDDLQLSIEHKDVIDPDWCY